MKVAVIAIGDELLIGQVADTNSGDIARRIAPLGWTISSVQVVHDCASDIRLAIDRAISEADIVITTGGIGPTKDDITKQTLCDYFGGVLIEDPETLDNVKKIVSARGLKLNDLTARQALVPSSCYVIQNQVGTAPITWWRLDSGKVLISMPGVPFETRYMLDVAVIPMLRDMFGSDETIIRKTLVFSGISESQLATMLESVESNLPDCLHFAYLPKDSIIRLRIDGIHVNANVLNNAIEETVAALKNVVGQYVISEEDQTPEEILISILREKGLTVSTAESCTGGNIAHRITAVPGASDVYAGSVVAYSNTVKTSVLNVDSEDINKYGAVSCQVVEQMATGIQSLLNTDIAIATSGIAGPGGGSAEKPVGTVWMAVASNNGIVHSAQFNLPGSRDRVISLATVRALAMAIKQVIEY